MLVNMAGSVAVLASQFGPGILCIVVTTGVGYVGLLSVFRKRSAELRAEYVDHCDNKAAMKNESITNVDLVKYFGTEPYEINRYSKSLLRAQKADWECDIYEYTFSLLEEGLKVAGKPQMCVYCVPCPPPLACRNCCRGLACRQSDTERTSRHWNFRDVSHIYQRYPGQL